MAQQTLNNGATFLDQRNKINENFTEVYVKSDTNTTNIAAAAGTANYAAALAAQQDRELAAFIQNYKQQKSFVNLLPSDPMTFTRASSATYFDDSGVMQTAASGVKRYTHDPLTLQPLGLLIEEQRTNLFTYSNDFTHASWTKTNTTVSVVSDYFKVTDTAVDSSHYIGKNNAVSVTNGQSYTWSGDFKAGEISIVQLVMTSTGFGANVVSTFDLVNKTAIQPTVGTASSANVKDIGDGWIRCSLTATATATTATTSFQARLAIVYSNTLSSYAGDGLKGVFTRKQQIEAGSFPTSYIPTTSAAVTRVADSILDTVNFAQYLIASSGTVFFDLDAIGYPARVSQIKLSDSDRYLISADTSSVSVQITVGGASNTASISASGSRRKIAFSWKNGIFILSCNGSSVVSTYTGNAISSLTSFYIGRHNSSYGNATFSRASVYKRALSQTELNGLTA